MGSRDTDGSLPSVPLLRDEEIRCTHFVAPTGSDDVTGSETQPWASFQHASESARPGDTVCFRDGRYVIEEGIQISSSGTPDEPISFVAYPGERPILDGGNEIGDLLALDLGASYLRVGGFSMRGFNVWGIDVQGDNRHIRLDHLTIEGGEAGVHFTYGDNDLAPPEGGPVEHITLEDSIIFDSEYTAVDCTPGPCNNMVFRRLEVFGSGLSGEASFGADGIAVSRGYPLLVEDCVVHDNGGDGIDLNSRDLDGHAQDVVVRRNQVVRNHQNGIKLWAGGRIENNVVWGQGNSALWLGTFHSALEVINNTIAFNMWDPQYSGRNWAVSVGYPEEIVTGPQVQLLLANNIFAYNVGPEVGEPSGVYLGPGVTISEHNNLYFSLAEGEVTAEFLDGEFSRRDIVDGAWTDRTGQGHGDLALDPLFLSGWPAVDLQLQALSPAIDAGDRDLCPSEDLNGGNRAVDGNADGEAACDLGAIEYGAEGL